MPDNNHYLKRVIPAHRKPKFMKWLAANLNPLRDVEHLLTRLDEAFDIDNAVGLQLDMIGDIIGRKRLLDFEPADGASPLLDDKIYRTLQKAKISINQWDGTIPGALHLWENLFPEYQLIIEDHQDMTMRAYIVGYTPILLRELVERSYVIPKPEGVRLNYEFTYETVYLCDLRVGAACSLEIGYDIHPCEAFTYERAEFMYVGAAYDIDKHYEINNLIERFYESGIKQRLGIALDVSREYEIRGDE